MSTALSTLRETLALKMRTRGVTGTATGGSTTAMADTSRDEEDDYWNHAWVTVKDTSGTETETREVDDFAKSTGQMDVLRAFSFTVGSGDTYEAHQKISVAELNDALNHAVRRARGKIMTKASATVTSSNNVYAYTLSSAATNVFDVRVQIDSTIATYPFYKMLKWRLQPGASTPTLQFNQAIDSGYTIRYYYTRHPTEVVGTLAADDDTTTLPLDYVYAAARSELYNVLAADAKDDNEFRRYMTKHDDYNREAERLLRRYSTQAPAKRVLKESELLGGERWYEVTYGKAGLD